MPAFFMTVQHIIGVLAWVLREEKEIENTQSENEEVKLSLFAYDMILFVKNPKDSTENLLALKIQQSCRIQNQHVKISFSFIYLL